MSITADNQKVFMINDYTVNNPSKPRVVKEEKNIGIYEIDGLYPGYGYTIGNVLRRIILSSISGAAITRVKIKDAKHEFSTIKGVKEDILVILLNLKRIRFQIHSGDGPFVVKLNKKGLGIVTAKDIELPSQVKVSNTDQYIAEITDNSSSLSMEITIDKGIGFVSREEYMDKVEIGEIVLDALFSPVRRVHYEVEQMRVGNRIDFNKLRLTIETDGTVKPSDVLKSAVSIAITQFQAISLFKEDLPEVELTTEEEKTIQEERGNIDDLGLQPRVLNALRKANMNVITDIEEKTKKELTNIPGIGKNAVSEIEDILAERGLELRNDKSNKRR